MPPAYALQFMPGVEVRAEGEDILVAGGSGQAFRLARPGAALRALLDLLARGGKDREAICDDAMAAGTGDGPADLARLYFSLGAIERKGFVRYTLAERGRALATLEPCSPRFRFEDPAGDGPYQLSRFAWMRRVDGAMMVECPLGHARIILHDARATALLGHLATPHSAPELAAALPEFDAATIAAILSLLVNARMAFAGEDAVPLRQWEFHDLLFHSRSRLGRQDAAYGGTFRFRDVLAPLPAVKPPMSGRRIALFKPDLAALAASDPSFSRVTEARRSVRARGAQPLGAEQLGEFLFRAARVKELGPAAGAGIPYQSSMRPCAGGGGMHEIEIYLTLARCTGIEPGLYHYDPLAHDLEHVADLGAPQRRLLADACASSGIDGPPDALITLSARFQRMAWKYQSMAYAVTLKNAGALYQQMYLVATAMNLAPCGLGGGDSDLFAEAAGLDYYVESSVGEFMLSGR